MNSSVQFPTVLFSINLFRICELRRRYSTPLIVDPLDGAGREALTIETLRTSARAYLLLALGWTSLFWTAVALSGTPENSMNSILFMVGGVGPFALAVALTHLREPSKVRRDFWIRAVDPTRLHGPWWAIALFLHPALIVIAFAADIALGGAMPAVKVHLTSAYGILSLLAFVFLFGPVPEEIAWRGFALDRLQNRMTALHASLVLGSAWALWHVPLFFIPGTFQADIGLGSARSWVLLSSMLPLSVLMTWIYNNTDRSTLSAVLVHFSGNLCGALFAKSTRVAAIELLLLSLAAVLVTAGWGARHLSKQ